MKKEILILSTILLNTVNIASADTNSNYPTKAFDANYKVTNSQGISDLRMASDGHGLFMTQSKMNGFQSTTIVNYLTGTSTSLIEQGKMAVESKLPIDGGYIADEASAKKQGGKAIGTKVINGHPCHGYEFNKQGSKSQTWIGDDCKILVQSTTDTAAGKVIMDLKSFATNPTTNLFKVPTDYKMMTQ